MSDTRVRVGRYRRNQVRDEPFVKMCVSVPESVRAELWALATSERISVSELTTRLLREGLAPS